jgi:hypothetical protein
MDEWRNRDVLFMAEGGMGCDSGHEDVCVAVSGMMDRDEMKSIKFTNSWFS